MAEILLKEEKVFDMVYKAVNAKANSNAFIQGISGIAGFPATLAVDGLVILTHYEPLINNIRDLYGRSRVSSDNLFPVVGSMLKEIIIDIAVDKVMGNIPVAGIYFNAVAAKALTWRLGMITAIISARGDELSYTNLSEIVKLVRLLTPQSDMFRFTKPDYETFKKITLSVSGDDVPTFNEKVQSALKAFE